MGVARYIQSRVTLRLPPRAQMLPHDSSSLSPRCRANRIARHLSSRLATIVVLAWTGCHSPSQYTSPRVTGRVLNEQTQQPIQAVQVRRSADKPTSHEAPKGAQLLVQAPSVLTEANGSFALKSERALAFLWHIRWYSVTVSFTHPGYEALTRTFSLANSTNSPTGEPLVEAGDVLLRPLGKKP
jgi:hypothetical protein